jgi:hypothetical protein
MYLPWRVFQQFDLTSLLVPFLEHRHLLPPTLTLISIWVVSSQHHYLLAQIRPRQIH